MSANTNSMKELNKLQKLAIGGAAGVLNGLFGAGGGVVTVPMLERSGLEQRKCHATSVALVFMLSLVSTTMYALQGKLDYGKTLEFVPSGIVGALVGAIVLKKVNNTVLKRIFGVIIIVSAIRMLIA